MSRLVAVLKPEHNHTYGELELNRKARGLACKVLYTTLTAHTAQALHPWRCQRDGGGLARTRHPTNRARLKAVLLRRDIDRDRDALWI